MSSPVLPPEPRSFREDACASQNSRVVLVPLDDASSQVSRCLLAYTGKHVFRKNKDTLLLLHVVPPVRWRADLDAPGAGLANALAAGVSVSTLNRFADAKSDDDSTNGGSWLDDNLKLLEASVLERAAPTLVESGVPKSAILCDVVAAPITNASIGDTICAVAKDVDARLVVMAKRGFRGALSEAVLGSATNRVVYKCEKPVLVWNVAPELTNKRTEKDADDVDDPAFV